MLPIMIKQRLFGWCASFLAVSLMWLLFCCPLKVLALSGSNVSPSAAVAPPSADIAGGSAASTTSQSTVQANSNAVTDPTPSDASTQDADQQPVNNSASQVTPPSTTQDNQASSVTNNVNANSQSGNTNVAQSPVGGDATSGSATASATLINTIGSSVGQSSTPWQTFTDNITGNQTGNVSVDPTTIPSPSSPSTAQTPDTTPSTVQTASSIDNNVTLLAGSGDATVENNGVGGNATSGPATADANLINVIDSAITDQQSFLGIINIIGNLTGNIVLPQNLINALSIPTTATDNGSGATQLTNNFLINNNVTLLAQSGQAAVVSNGNSGNATSGNTTTNLELYNLINSQINGGNLLLVFVNVLGSWTGFLLSEPAGTDSAAVGSGIQEISPSMPAPMSSTASETINNYLYLDASSGNALDAYNTLGGNAASGNATSSADIVNILGDQVNLSGWLGVLIINVFGSWNGSLVTSDPPATGTVQGQASYLLLSPSASTGNSTGLTTLIRHFHQQFTASADPANFSPDSIVLTSAIISHNAGIFGAHTLPISAKSNTNAQHNAGWFSVNLVAVLLMTLAVILLIAERILAHRKVH